MSDVLPSTTHEFWRPPASAQPSPAISISTGLAEVCKGCGGEFMVGSHFCHVCGTERLNPAQMDWTRYLDVQSIKAFFGLTTLTLAAFLVGIACLLAALMVGVVYNVQDYSDFQAVQFWRVEWLLGAVAAFVAGILLKQKA